MAVAAQFPPALPCPRCPGVRVRKAADALDWLCLFCGDTHGLVPTKASLEPLTPPEALVLRPVGTAPARPTRMSANRADLTAPRYLEEG